MVSIQVLGAGNDLKLTKQTWMRMVVMGIHVVFVPKQVTAWRLQDCQSFRGLAVLVSTANRHQVPGA
jgi:limonene-1,2-epoxide hydrolase